MMDLLLRFFDFFNQIAKNLAGYLPQSGGDLINLFYKLISFASGLNSWITENVGVNLQIILMSIGRLAVLSANFIFEFLKNIVGRL